jgi:hypothetical protein
MSPYINAARTTRRAQLTSEDMMRTHIKLTLTGIIAAMALSLGVSSATALRSISINGLEAGGAMNFSSRVTFHRTGEPTNAIICNVTLLRTVVRSIPKVAGSNMGRVIGVAIDTGVNNEHCAGGGGVTGPISIVALVRSGTSGVHRELGAGIQLYDVSGSAAELWRLVYDSFSGTLPAITNINFHIEKVQLLFRFRDLITFNCLIEGPIYFTIILGGRSNEAEIASERTSIESRERGCEFVNPLTARGRWRISPVISASLI